tara:strand:+ start:463 stop:1167 length:705 start_codon:yes stop_codon:yes gene_type:complete
MEEHDEMWNDYHEELLKNWAEMSKTYSIMHSLCANHYANIDKLLGIPVIILGAVTASSIFGTSNYNDIDHFYLNYINGGLALIITALTGVNKFLGSAEKRIKHQTASFKYTSIAMNIDTMLSFSRDKRRVDPQDFASEQKSKILEIRENCPEVVPKIMSSYLNNYNKSLLNIDSNVNKENQDKKIKNHTTIDINNTTYYSSKTKLTPLIQKFDDKSSKEIEKACRILSKKKSRI